MPGIGLLNQPVEADKSGDMRRAIATAARDFIVVAEERDEARSDGVATHEWRAGPRSRDAGWIGYTISRMRTKRPLREPVREAPGPKLKNYITPAGLQRLKEEHRFLMNRERPAMVQVVAWAASNGDRSENADYLYGKRRLRQIDSRIRFLTKRIDSAEVVDPAARRPGSAATRVFFGATVTYRILPAGLRSGESSTTVGQARAEHVVCIVGIDEIDVNRRYISWRSPLANALMKSSPGDRVVLRAPTKTEHLEILDVEYAPIPMDPFREPPGAESAPKGSDDATGT